MKRWMSLALGTALLAGCGSNTGVAVADRTSTAIKGYSTTPQTLVGNASGNLNAPEHETPISGTGFDMQPFVDASGLIGGFSKLTEKDMGYHTQLMPGTTQFQADMMAKQWSEDAKQVYVGWGFWKTSLLAQTQHYYYSDSKKKKYIITFKLVTWKKSTKEEDAPNFGLANKILKGAYDIHNYDGNQAHSRAKMGGYKPAGRNDVGVLIHPLVLGPLWVWMDDEDKQYPMVAIKANSGEIIKDGLWMKAIRYMFAQK